MSDEIKKSNYGPAGTAAGAQYQPHANQERKANNTGDVVHGIGHNKNVKSYSSKPGQLSAKQQAATMHGKRRTKALSGPVKILSSEEIAQIQHTFSPPGSVKKDEMLDEEIDGKQEVIEGKEPLKKDPKKKGVKVLPDGSAFFTATVGRWKDLKKALNHEKAFMDLEEEMSSDEEEQEPQPEQADQSQMDDSEEYNPAQEIQDELSSENGGEQSEGEDKGDEQSQEDPSGEDAESPLEAVSVGEEDEQAEPKEQENPEEGNENAPPDPQELIEALKEEGYSDQEIAYIVHGHHAPEVDVSKQAKAQATQAMSDVDIENARAMAELERKHHEESMAAEREHKKRMSDLEYEQAQKKHTLVDQDAQHKQRMSDLEYQQAQNSNPASIEQAHKQRMLDLEYEKAKRESEASDGSEGDAEANKQMKQLEVEKKKLELKLRAEEIKLELEFKKREHELKLKLMEAQIKEQAKQKSEISGIKHKQKIADAKSPPAKLEKKSLKKSEEEEDEQN